MIKNFFTNKTGDNHEDEDNSSSWSDYRKFPSMGLKSINESLESLDHDTGKPLILDLSCARQSVAEYARDLNCVYTVTNAIPQLIEENNRSNESADSENSRVDYAEIFESVIRYSRKNSIDRPVSVILVWDLLNYLERTEIINLMAYLSPFCHTGTKLFAISWITETIPSQPGWFEVTPQLELTYESMIDEHIDSPEYSAPNIVDMMPSFKPHRLSITRFGMLEVLLQFKNLIQPPNIDKIPYQKLSAYSKV